MGYEKFTGSGAGPEVGETEKFGGGVVCTHLCPVSELNRSPERHPIGSVRVVVWVVEVISNVIEWPKLHLVCRGLGNPVACARHSSVHAKYLVDIGG